MRTLKLATYFALWYALNVGYNIYNKVRKFYSSGLGGYSLIDSHSLTPHSLRG